jgi:hypothetical protein
MLITKLLVAETRCKAVLLGHVAWKNLEKSVEKQTIASHTIEIMVFMEWKGK